MAAIRNKKTRLIAQTGYDILVNVTTYHIHLA